MAIPLVHVDPGSGFDTNSGAPGKPKHSVTEALAVVDPNGHIVVMGGTLSENITINKQGIKLSADPLYPSPIISSPPHSPANTSLITVTASDIKVEGFTLIVNQPNAAVGVNFVSGDNLSVTNNIMYTTGTGGDASTYAAGSPTQSIGLVSANIGKLVTLSGNYIGFTTADPASTSPFDRAVFLRSVHGSITGNFFCGINHDVAIQSVNGGPMLISSNSFLGWGNDRYTGAQLDLAEPENAITVSSNTFTPQTDDIPAGRIHIRSLIVKNNSAINAPNIQIISNTFNLRKVGILAANSIGETIHQNTFHALPEASDFQCIQINNKVPTTGSPAPNTNNAIITSNIFGAGPGTGIALYNHNSAPVPSSGLFRAITIGGPSSQQNTFEAGLASYITLDGQMGLSQASLNDGYAGFGNTTMAPYPADLDISHNSFGSITGSAASTLQSYAIENKINHRMDTDHPLETGLVTWRADELFVTDPAGPDSTDSSIQRGVDSATPGNTIHVQSGTYTELITANKANLTLLGDTPKPLVQAPSDGTGAAVFTVDSSGVSIDNFALNVEHPYAWSGIRSAGNNFDHVQINNNDITALGTYTYTSGQYHYGIELPNFSSLSRSVNIGNNTINSAPGANVFQHGIFLRSCHGTVGGIDATNGNDIKAGIQDILAQFCGFGTTQISHNTIRGAGIDVTEPESHGPVDISQNVFAPEILAAQSLLIKHSYAGAAITIEGNTFTNHQYRGILATGSNGITIKNNQFDAASTSIYSVAHVEFNTQWPGSASAPYNPNSYELTDNSFKNTGTGTVDGLLIANGYTGLQSPDFSKLTIGKSGEENDFYSGINRFIVLSNAATQETTEYISIADNRFDVGAGLTLPSAMTAAQNFRLEDRIFHKVDATPTGLATWIPQQIFITNPQPGSTDSDIARGVAASGPANYTVNIEPGLYTGSTPVIDAKSSFTLAGSDPLTPPIISTGFVLGSTGSTNLSLHQLSLNGQANGGEPAIIRNDGDIVNFKMSNVLLDGDNALGRHGIFGGTFAGDIAFDRCNFTNIINWSAFDSDSAAAGTNITTATFTNNTLTNVQGHIHFRHNEAQLPYPNINISNNTITGGTAKAPLASAAITVSNGNNVSVVHNIFQNIPAATAQVPGEEHNGCAFMPRNISKLYVSHNTFRNNNVGIATEPGQPISTGGINNNIFSNNGVGIYFPNNPTTPGALQIANNYFDGHTTYSIRNGSSYMINATSNWFGNPTGPATPQNGPSANVKISPWAGAHSDHPTDVAVAAPEATALSLTTLAGTPQAPAGADIVSAADTFTGGETFTLFEDAETPFQGINGFQLPGGLPRTLHFNTNVPAGSYITTMKLGYTNFDISGYIETELYLAAWDAENYSWEPAIKSNIGGTAHWQGASLPLPPTPANLGKYGVDITNNIAWAVVNHASEYAVGSGSGTLIVPVALSAFSLE